MAVMAIALRRMNVFMSPLSPYVMLHKWFRPLGMRAVCQVMQVRQRKTGTGKV
jgi:hypothetical protein